MNPCAVSTISTVTPGHDITILQQRSESPGSRLLVWKVAGVNRWQVGPGLPTYRTYIPSITSTNKDRKSKLMANIYMFFVSEKDGGCFAA